MRMPLAFLSLTLASGALLASDYQGDFNWVQIQAGITDHRTQNSQRVQPAFGLGVGTWLNGNWGLEASVLGTYVNYGYGKAKEAHATGSVLFNPFPTPASIPSMSYIRAIGQQFAEPLSLHPPFSSRLPQKISAPSSPDRVYTPVLLCRKSWFFGQEGIPERVGIDKRPDITKERTYGKQPSQGIGSFC